jgi:hypothetical protein
MTADPVLLLAWLILAHLAADFVFQTDWMATAKADDGARAMRALVVHAAIVGLCLVPLPLAFGLAGLVALLLIAISHGVVDRVKAVLTRRAEAAALARARQTGERAAPAASLGTAWTPLPAFWFALDQAVHLAVTAAAVATLLGPTPVEPGFARLVGDLVGARDPGAVHATVLTGVVVLSLLIVNVRAGALFVAVLVHPREAVTGSDPAARSAAAPLPGWTVTLGPLTGRAQPDAVPSHPPAPASPAQVGLVIGVLERLLIVALVLAHAEAAIGLVVAAKTLARFRQLDDRAFAEYYLLGTLASVSVAIGSALLAAAAFASLG